MRYIELFERSRQSLYHATKIELSVPIVEYDIIRANTTQTIETQSKNAPYGFFRKNINGVSLTRSWRFAQAWSHILFEFDQDQLKTKFRFIPFNYFYSHGNGYNHRQRREAEEFLVGPLTNMNKYLKYIWVWSTDTSKLSLERTVIDKY